jgi:hypothetical protein
MPLQVDICNRALSVIGTRSSIASMTEGTPEALACSTHFEGACRAMLRLAPWSFARTVVQAALIAAAPGTLENPNGYAPLPLVPISDANPAGSTPIQIVSWQYEYTWPQDCVRLRQVKEPFDQPNSGNTVLPFWPGMMEAPLFLGGLTGMDLSNRVPYQISLDKDASGNQIKVILTNIEYALIVYTAFVDNPNLWDDEFSEAFVFMLASHLVGALIGDKQLDTALYKKASDMATVARAVDGNEQPVSPNHTPDWIRARGGLYTRPDIGPEPWDVWGGLGGDP